MLDLPVIYTKTSLRWDDIKTMPRGELDALLHHLRGDS